MIDMEKRLKDIKLIFEDILSLSGNKYTITYLTSKYGTSIVRTAHFMLVKMNVVRKIGSRLYEVIDRKKLEEISKWSDLKIEKTISKFFSKMNKESRKYTKYKGRNASIQMIMETNGIR